MQAKRWLLVLALRALGLTMLVMAAQAASAQGSAPLGNATCLACHGSPGATAPLADGHSLPLFVPADQFADSIHATLPCTACHTTITGIPHQNAPKMLAEWDQTRLTINKNCGNCHATAAQSYAETYHGQVAALGYANVATCSDCHGNHAIRYIGDPASSVSPANILKTCQKCHQDATPGFATFQSHATTDDFALYPYTWIASKFVLMLIVVTFGVFWTHSALWFYRELRDHQQRRPRPHVRADALPRGEGLPQAEGGYYQRWSLAWRCAHLTFALSVIVLVMTGIALLYPNTAWAPVLERIFGGPIISGIVHRAAAVIMIAVFAAHLIYAAIHIARNWTTFKWFGPYSLLPNLQDAWDLIAMLKWFFGKGPRPTFDHWNYQQKFDYWAPFWGITMLAATGAMLWFKTLTATYLPGWVFNVATVVHGDEAVLAALYLFTIHFFANHWRPDKFPLDAVMFTGSMPLEEFKREYTVEYGRLVETGELRKHLVDAPSQPMTLGSKILGFSLVAVGLALLVLMVIGIGGNLMAG